MVLCTCTEGSCGRVEEDGAAKQARRNGSFFRNTFGTGKMASQFFGLGRTNKCDGEQEPNPITHSKVEM